LSDIQFQIVATKQELEDAFHVRQIVFVDEQQVPKELEMDQYEDDSLHFIVYLTDRPIATARIRSYLKEDTAKVERVAVLKEFRGTGIGKQLMQYIEQEATKKGYSTLRLNAQQHAESFYEELGYQTISEPFDEAGIQHVTMEKRK